MSWHSMLSLNPANTCGIRRSRRFGSVLLMFDNHNHSDRSRYICGRVRPDQHDRAGPPAPSHDLAIACCWQNGTEQLGPCGMDCSL